MDIRAPEDISTQTKDKPKVRWTLQFDGGSRPFSRIRLGGGGWILADPSGKVVQGRSLYFGRKHPTNNAAELKALERALAEVEE